jgi:hypothetical protein
MPSSQRKLESARINGAKSVGPVTEEGRQAVARNALKHGLTAHTVVLDNESSEEYEAVLQCYLDRFQPQCIIELDLVHQIAAAAWRLARSAGVESGLLSRKMHEQSKWLNEEHPGIPEKERTAIAFDALADRTPALSLINRYQARFHHEYQRTLKCLFQIQAIRLAREAKLPNKPSPISGHQPSTPPIASLIEPAEVPQ